MKIIKQNYIHIKVHIVYIGKNNSSHPNLLFILQLILLHSPIKYNHRLFSVPTIIVHQTSDLQISQMKNLDYSFP